MKPATRHCLLLLGIALGTICAIELTQPGRLDATPRHLRARMASGRKGPPKPPFGVLPYGAEGQTFLCQVDGERASQELADFGYPKDAEANLAKLDRRLEMEISAHAQKIHPDLDLLCHTTVRHKHVWPIKLGILNWIPEVEYSNLEPSPFIAKECAQQRAWIDRELGTRPKRIFGDYLREHGFTRDEIFYSEIVDRERPLLADCYNKIFRVVGLGRTDDEIRTALLSTIQNLPKWDPLPLTEGEKFTAGYFVPIKTLRLGGDCDSKAAALAALWQSPGPQIALFRFMLATGEEPTHMYLGVERTPQHGETYITTSRNRMYVLYETLDDRSGETVHRDFSEFDPIPTGRFCMTSNCGF